LSKTLTIDGKPLEDSRALSSVIKVNDVVHFDCHIYDKGSILQNSISAEKLSDKFSPPNFGQISIQ
jgi:hypothetical protein